MPKISAAAQVVTFFQGFGCSTAPKRWSPCHPVPPSGSMSGPNLEAAPMYFFCTQGKPDPFLLATAGPGSSNSRAWVWHWGVVFLSVKAERNWNPVGLQSWVTFSLGKPDNHGEKTHCGFTRCIFLNGWASRQRVCRSCLLGRRAGTQCSCPARCPAGPWHGRHRFCWGADLSPSQRATCH